MAIRSENINLMDIGCEVIDRNFKDICICELGNQYTKDHLEYKTGKEYLTALGADHISIDLNGKDGAVREDLSKPITRWIGCFDMVTNYGTSEHVANQYMVFKNIHNLVKVGGVMIHVSPQAGYWGYHGLYNYELGFFEELAQKNNYKIILNESRKFIHKTKIKHDLYNVSVVLVKLKSDLFISEEDFKNIKGLRAVR